MVVMQSSQWLPVSVVPGTIVPVPEVIVSGVQGVKVAVGVGVGVGVKVAVGVGVRVGVGLAVTVAVGDGWPLAWELACRPPAPGLQPWWVILF